MFFEQFISGDNDNVLQNKGNVYIRRLHNDSKALFLPGTGGRVLSPLEDGRGSPAVTPRVSKAAMKGTNRTILFAPCVLVVVLKCLFSGAQQRRMSKTNMTNKARCYFVNAMTLLWKCHG